MVGDLRAATISSSSASGASRRREAHIAGKRKAGTTAAEYGSARLPHSPGEERERTAHPEAHSSRKTSRKLGEAERPCELPASRAGKRVPTSRGRDDGASDRGDAHATRKWWGGPGDELGETERRAASLEVSSGTLSLRPSPALDTVLLQLQLNRLSGRTSPSALCFLTLMPAESDAVEPRPSQLDADLARGLFVHSRIVLRACSACAREKGCFFPLASGLDGRVASMSQRLPAIRSLGRWHSSRRRSAVTQHLRVGDAALLPNDPWSASCAQVLFQAPARLSHFLYTR